MQSWFQQIFNSEHKKLRYEIWRLFRRAWNLGSADVNNIDSNEQLVLYFIDSWLQKDLHSDRIELEYKNKNVNKEHNKLQIY